MASWQECGPAAVASGPHKQLSPERLLKRPPVGRCRSPSDHFLRPRSASKVAISWPAMHVAKQQCWGETAGRTDVELLRSFLIFARSCRHLSVWFSQLIISWWFWGTSVYVILRLRNQYFWYRASWCIIWLPDKVPHEQTSKDLLWTDRRSLHNQ